MSAKIIPTKSMIDKMCDMVATGATRQEIADALGMSRATFNVMVIREEFPEVKKAYLLAKQAYAGDVADQVIAISAAPLPDNPKLANAEVSRRKVLTDNIKWVAQKLMPKVYGDNIKINHEHSGKVELSPLAQLRGMEAPKIAQGKVVDVEPATVDESDCF